MMIMVKMTDLEKEEWIWFKIYIGLLFIFSIPFTVGLHKYDNPSYDCCGHHPTRSNDDMEDSTDDDLSYKDTQPEEQLRED